MLVSPEILIDGIDAYYYSTDDNGFYYCVFLLFIGLRDNEEYGNVRNELYSFFYGVLDVDGKNRGYNIGGQE